jgi:hypothetical protein
MSILNDQRAVAERASIATSLWRGRRARSWRRRAGQFEAAMSMFGGSPFEAQLLALVVIHHPWFFEIVGAKAAPEHGS